MSSLLRVVAALVAVIVFHSPAAQATQVRHACAMPGIELRGTPGVQGGTVFVEAVRYSSGQSELGIAFCSTTGGAGFSTLRVGEGEFVNLLRVSPNGKYALVYARGPNGDSYYRYDLSTEVALDLIPPVRLALPSGNPTFYGINNAGGAWGNFWDAPAGATRPVECLPVGCRPFNFRGSLYDWTEQTALGIGNLNGTSQSFVVRDGIAFGFTTGNQVLALSSGGTLIAGNTPSEGFRLSLDAIKVDPEAAASFWLASIPVAHSGLAIVGAPIAALSSFKRQIDSRSVVGIVYQPFNSFQTRVWTGTTKGMNTSDQTADEWLRAELGGPLYLDGLLTAIQTIEGVNQIGRRLFLSVTYRNSSTSGAALVELEL